MKAWVWMAIVGVLVLNAVAVPGVMANALRGNGTVIPLTGVDDGGKTADYYLRTWGVPLLGTGIGLTGMAMLSSYPVTGILGIVGGVGTAFWPSVMGSTQDQAAAATLGALATQMPPSLWMGWLWSAMAQAAPMALVISAVGRCRKGASVSGDHA